MIDFTCNQLIQMSPETKKLQGRQAAFSLIEVTIALGLSVFALTAIMGVLPVGLRSVQDSAQQQGISNISRQLRAELQQIPFLSTGTSSYSLEALESKTLYFTRNGERSEESGRGNFFSVNLNVGKAKLSGGETDTYDENVRNVTVTLAYPLDAPEAKRQKEVFSLILARQGIN